ncbi:MAG: ABC transporter substrate-binding protein [Actinomycetes bacterium]
MRRMASLRAAALLACTGVLLAACAGTSNTAASTPATSSSAKPCGTVNIADNPWVGYEADVAVVSYLLKTKLGCTVNISKIDEQVSWQGFGTGQVDVILENWGHADLVTKYITTQKVAQDFGSQGNQGIIGWYVPAWMATKYPDITNWQNLNKYSSLFVTSESGGKGQLLDGDPSYVTNDAALITGLKLNYKVVVGGSEAALIKSLQTATQQTKALLFYFYEPQWALANLKVARVTLPPYTAGCDANPKSMACDYPPYPLNKVVRVAWANSGSPAVNLVQNFKWTNDDQNKVAEMIANENMTDDQAAQKWVDANPTVWKAWFAGTGLTP